MENKMYWGRSKWHSAGPLQRVGWILGGVVLAVFLAFIFGYFVMLLWNWIMPAIFGLPEIDYWLAFGIIILARLIFGGFGHGYNHNCKDERAYGSHHPRFSHRKPPFDKTKEWKYYGDFWNEEGEKSFNEYIERKKADKQEGDEKENPVE